MTGARRGRPEDKVASGRELWTIEGTNMLIRKLQNDPGLTEESRKEFIESVRSGALEKKIGAPEEILQYRPSKKETPMPQSEPEVNKTVTTPKPTAIKEKAKSAEAAPKPAPVKIEVKSAPPAPVPTLAAGKNDFDAYQDFTSQTAVFPAEVGVPYTSLGLNGEAAEVAGKLVAVMSRTILANDGMAVDENRDNLYHLNSLFRSLAKTGVEVEKLKKALRKGEKKLPPIKSVTAEEKKELAKEVGDVLWYCAQLSRVLGFKLSDIAAMNVEKLSSRKARGVLHGNGDNR